MKKGAKDVLAVVTPNARNPEDFQLSLPEFKQLKEEFKAWVENTPLFNAIIMHSGTGVMIQAITDDETMMLEVSRKKISTFEELPKELLIKFFENSSWSYMLKYFPSNHSIETKDE